MMCVHIVHGVHVKERRCFSVRDPVRRSKIQVGSQQFGILLSVTIFGEGGQGDKKTTKKYRQEIEEDHRGAPLRLETQPSTK